MAKSSDFILRPRSRRKKSDLHKCQDCSDILSEDNWTPSMQKYRRYVCRICWTKRQKRYAEADPNSRKKKNEQRRKRQATWSEERKILENRKKYNTWLIREYNINIDDYDNMLKNQNHKCAICFTDEPLGRGRFHVDHCHSKGHVRGLLCTSCNMMLGLVGDCPERLTMAINYLAETKEGDQI